MRRKEFDQRNDEEIEQFLHEMSFGFLGMLSEDDWPHVIPLNFVYHKGAIYIHGSKIGEKIRCMAKNNKVTFTVAKEFAVIPSYFTDPIYACPATAFFKSVLARGRSELLEDLQEKAEVFTVLMEKLQPEGGYLPFDIQDSGYAAQLKSTAMVKIHIEQLTAKFKFGQNWPEKRITDVGEQLLERGKPDDAETVRLMKLYCPHYY